MGWDGVPRARLTSSRDSRPSPRGSRDDETRVGARRRGRRARARRRRRARAVGATVMSTVMSTMSTAPRAVKTATTTTTDARRGGTGKIRARGKGRAFSSGRPRAIGKEGEDGASVTSEGRRVMRAGRAAETTRTRTIPKPKPKPARVAVPGVCEAPIRGNARALGATRVRGDVNDAVNFAVYSSAATAVSLVL